MEWKDSCEQVEQTMHIWLLAGYAGSGKTTAGEMLHTLLPQSCMTAFAKEVKNQVAEVYKLPRGSMDTQEGKATFVEIEQKTVRQLLVEHAAWMKQVYDSPGIWAEYVCREIKAQPDIEHWILHDWRYIAELRTLQTQFPNARMYTLRIQSSRTQLSNCPSEHELDSFQVQHTVSNDGSLAELRMTLLQLIHTSHR